eukprot:CAMPEP_0197656384 /NCGR_PEP_ID=MMETSP1338-20131121/41646_1 /TAXON_ID=43686 ORGANISM="Pelagodinium beii, Strain RCC1491" /NCGR_SAMPLE_ID=MMETSP1338 /ASSEMBLY_ACC=CAM_ASM_000754 /LENGTH=228 /DNA_ID=CAMNT_0043232369 /DNA_START=56 /DNA_END=742 /DNA_ORIENTATION=-
MESLTTSQILEENRKANELLNNGEYEEAEPLLRQAVERTKEQNNAETFMWMRRLSECQVELGKFKESEIMARDAARALNIKFGQNDEDTLDCKLLHGESLYMLRKIPEAGPIIASTLEGLDSNLKRGPEHVNTMKCRALHARILKFTDPAQASEIAEHLKLVLDRPIMTQGRRVTPQELRGADKVKQILGDMLNVQRKPRDGKQPEAKESIQTVSTEAPEDADELQVA